MGFDTTGVCRGVNSVVDFGEPSTGDWDAKLAVTPTLSLAIGNCWAEPPTSAKRLTSYKASCS